MFKIISKEHYDELEHRAEFWENSCNISNQTINNLRRECAIYLKEKDQAIMTQKHEFTGFSLSIKGGENNFFEVVRNSDGKFLVCKGFETKEEALAKAEELAVHYPVETFYVYGPLVKVKANIPVVSEVIDNG